MSPASWKTTTWKAVAVGGAMGGIAVATGKAVVEAGKYLADLGNEYNTAINQLSAATGATGDELDALGESVKNIYAQGLGDDFADVADGLAATQQASDPTGEALERATAAGFNLRDVFDYDVSESARAASALMKNFGIDAEEAYGFIAVGAQNGADKNGDLLDTLNEYSPQFAALGLSADQFIGTLVEGADAGLFSIDKVGDAVKEFNIRAKDGSDTSREAFESLGLNADKMFAAFAAGGDTAEAAFFDTVEALNSMDYLARNAAGVACSAHSSRIWRPACCRYWRASRPQPTTARPALQQINDVKYNDLGSAFEAIKVFAEVSLLPMASMIASSDTDGSGADPAGDLRGHRPRHHGNAQRLYAVCAAVPHGNGAGPPDRAPHGLATGRRAASAALAADPLGLPAAAPRAGAAVTPAADADRAGHPPAHREHPDLDPANADADHLRSCPS